MAIERINPALLMDLSSLETQNNTDKASDITFKDLLEKSVNKVNEAEQLTVYDSAVLAAGDADVLHELTINMAKADIALQTLVQVRNKVLNAYNEIMRITL